MKKMNKVFALLIAMVMVFSMSTSAFAASIEVKGVVDDETYTAYKILNYTNSGDAYSYYLTAEEYEKIGAALEAAGFAFQVSADGSQYYVTNAEDFDAAAAAAALAAADLGDALGKYEAIGAEGEANFTDLATGYYFITSSLGSLCALHDDNGIATVVEKNTMLTDKKEVDLKSDSLQVGDVATYTITLTDGKGTNLPATVTDTMSAGLTYNNDAVITANGVELTSGSDYTVTITGGNGVETVIVYNFTADVMEVLEENEQIIITYTATLNQYASLDGSETNTAYTQYSEQETSGTTITVKNYSLEIQKTDSNGGSLEGAQFEIYRTDADNGIEHERVSVVDITDTIEAAEEGYVYYRVAAADEEGATTTIDMTEATNAVIYGLDGDSTYFLREIKAPEGYNLLKDEVELAMGDANKVQPVVNFAGTELPSTGGMGTTILYVVGGILVVAAVVLLFVKRRVEEN